MSFTPADLKPVEPIFVLIAVEDGVHGSRSRAWGWYPTRELAEKDILAKDNDLIFESGTFAYALIEEVPWGFMGSVMGDHKQWWYRAFHDNDTYEIKALDEAPEHYKNVIGFGMG